MTCDLDTAGLRHAPTQFCCAGCGRAFSNEHVFDAHRRQLTRLTRGCVDPATIPYAYGRERTGPAGTALVWGEPGKDPRYVK